MSWLALIDKTRTLFRLDGLARYGLKPGKDLVDLRAPMPSGSLVIVAGTNVRSSKVGKRLLNVFQPRT